MRNLLDLGVDLNPRNLRGNTALIFAAQGGNAAVIENLNHPSTELSAKNNRGWSAAHYACESGSEELISSFKGNMIYWNANMTISGDFVQYSIKPQASIIAR